MNGPSCMYTIRPFTKCDEDLKLPLCMYRMKNIQSSITCKPSSSNSSHTNSNDNNRFRSILEQNPLPQITNLEGRQEAVLAQLEQLKQQMALIKDLLKGSQPEMISSEKGNANTKKSFTELNMVINVSPQYPPYSLIALSNLCKLSSKPNIICHVHSSVHKVPSELSIVFQSNEDCGSYCSKTSITLIWKNVGRDAELILSPSDNIKIRGEVNILRFLSHRIPQFNYRSNNNVEKTTTTDALLDTCHSLLWSSTVKERQSLIRQLNANLKTCSFLMGESVTIADVAAWSVLKQLSITQELTVNMNKWYQKCTECFGFLL